MFGLAVGVGRGLGRVADLILFFWKGGGDEVRV